MLIVCTMCSTQARRRAGLRVSPGVLLQDQFIQREIRDGLPEALVLGLQRLHALDLIGLEPAALLPPAIVRHLGHPDCGSHPPPGSPGQPAHRPGAAWRQSLPACVSSSTWIRPPLAQKPYFRADHFKGGGSWQLPTPLRLAVFADSRAGWVVLSLSV